MAKSTEYYDALIAREYQAEGKKKTAWTRIGAAWPNKDGQGFRVKLNAFPVDGELILRLHQKEADSQ